MKSNGVALELKIKEGAMEKDQPKDGG